jgi:hypothetical protein
MLAKHPGDRYSTAHDLYVELRQFLDERKANRRSTSSVRSNVNPVESAGAVESAVQERQPLTRQRWARWKLLAGAFAVIVIVGGAAFTAMMYRTSANQTKWLALSGEVRKDADDFQLRVRRLRFDLKQTMPDTESIKKAAAVYQAALATAEEAGTSEQKEELQPMKRTYFAAHTNFTNKVGGLLDEIDHALPDGIQNQTAAQKNQLSDNLKLADEKLTELGKVDELLGPFVKGRISRLHTKEQSLAKSLSGDRANKAIPAK